MPYSLVASQVCFLPPSVSPFLSCLFPSIHSLDNSEKNTVALRTDLVSDKKDNQEGMYLIEEIRLVFMLRENVTNALRVP